MYDRAIIHMDLDAFFVSVERLRDKRPPDVGHPKTDVMREKQSGEGRLKKECVLGIERGPGSRFEDDGLCQRIEIDAPINRTNDVLICATTSAR